ncbi:hypothetical protein [Pseudonocardia spinosispora]|uniref:hypothetical protein n=1 Tax=Pseudonocardia spinosispora TaxID=103441 RepID=UPI0003F8B674|nr:hypothetical protein [Pseudonocardia spinosispora]
MHSARAIVTAAACGAALVALLPDPSSPSTAYTLVTSETHAMTSIERAALLAYWSSPPGTLVDVSAPPPIVLRGSLRFPLPFADLEQTRRLSWPSNVTAEHDATLTLENGFYCLCEDGSSGLPPSHVEPGRMIIPSSDGGALIPTGVSSGPVGVTVRVLGAPPGPADRGEWDQVEDAKLIATGMHVTVFPQEGKLPGFPRLSIEPGKPYHVRVSARTNPAGSDLPPRTHLVELWTNSAR